MTWFKSDDGLASHRKVLSLRRRKVQASERMAAMGLWELAGTWCMANLTDGHVPAYLPDELGGDDTLAAALVRVRLWHAKGHDCPVCPPTEAWVFHQWADDGNGVRRQPLRADIEAERLRKSEAGRAGGRASGRSRRSKSEAGASDPFNEDPNDDEAPASPFVEPPARPGPGKSKHLLTIVSRLAAGNARQPPPAEVIASWQEIAGTADLETEARAYLARYGDRPADDERNAWLGWLRRAAERATTTEQTGDQPGPGDPSEPARPPLGCGTCTGGWLPPAAGDDLERPRPCPTCRPRHLRPVEAMP